MKHVLVGRRGVGVWRGGGGGGKGLIVLSRTRVNITGKGTIQHSSLDGGGGGGGELLPTVGTCVRGEYEMGELDVMVPHVLLFFLRCLTFKQYATCFLQPGLI